MTNLTLQEATSLMHSYGMKCDIQLLEQWIKQGKLKGIENNGIYSVEEDKIYEFIHDCQWKGSAYEKGIDDQTKINRLLDEVDEYRKEKEELLKEIKELQMKLAEFGIMPF